MLSGAEPIDFKILWSNLLNAITKNQNPKIIEKHFIVLEEAIKRTPGYKEYCDFYMTQFSGEDATLLEDAPLIWDKRDKTTGDTLLIRATMRGQDLSVKRLIENGAFPHLENKAGASALDIALKGNPTIVDLILSKPIQVKPAQLSRISKLLAQLAENQEYEEINTWLHILKKHEEKFLHLYQYTQLLTPALRIAVYYQTNIKTIDVLLSFGAMFDNAKENYSSFNSRRSFH